MKANILILLAGVLLMAFTASAQIAFGDVDCAVLTYEDIEPQVPEMSDDELRELSAICRLQGEVYQESARQALSHDEKIELFGKATSAFGLATSINLEVAARPWRRWL